MAMTSVGNLPGEGYLYLDVLVGVFGDFVLMLFQLLWI